MSDIFVCPQCNSRHDDPAHAHLGHRLACVQCALEQDVLDGWDESAAAADPELIAA